MAHVHAGPDHPPEPPYFAVIFRSRRTESDAAAYEATAARMVELAGEQHGFLGAESFRSEDGTGVTISYWTDRDAIAQWGRHAEHQQAQRLGRDEFYTRFTLEICEVQEVRRINK